jgi:hypothetical protein
VLDYYLYICYDLPMKSPDQDPAQLDIDYSNRANVAARVAGVVLSLFGAEVLEGTLAQPVNAGVEIAATHESNNPHALITKVNNEALKIQDIMFSKAKELPGKTASANGGIFYMSEPGSKAGHYNLIFGSLQRPSNGKEILPFTLMVVMNSSGKTPQSALRGYDKSYQYIPAGTTETDVTVDLWENSGGPKGAVTRYRADGVGLVRNTKAINYAQHPGVVTAEFNKFLNTAEAIVTSGK